MDAGVYEADARTEETHWWFSGRRKLFARVIRSLGVASNDPVLDVGTSAGTNLRMLRDCGFANVMGLDVSDEAIRFCAEKGLGIVHKGDVLQMPFSSEMFSLVLATDVIEHVDDDVQAVTEVARVLRRGGKALFTVPAFSSLWGFQDEVSHHKRRYRMNALVDRIKKGGLEPQEAFYFNYLLFVPIWAARKLMRLLSLPINSESEMNSPFLNLVLTAIFDLDIATAPRLHPPFGVSVLVVAEKR